MRNSKTGKSAASANAYAGVEKMRSLKALAICAFVIVVVLLAILISDGSWASGQVEGSYVGKVWNSFEKNEHFDDALKEVGAVRLSKESIPEWMLDEVLDETWLDEAIMNSEQKVFWITKEGQLDEIRDQMTEALELKGWEVTSANTSETAITSYMKTEGECRWLLAEYVQSGEETVAVLRTERN